MTSGNISVGIVAPSVQDREHLREQVNATGLARVISEVDSYCSAPGDAPTRQLAEEEPRIIIVDMLDREAALKALAVLHTALPEAWLLVTSGVNEPDLIIETMRAGAREYLLRPISPSSLSQALGRYLAEEERSKQKHSGKIYCVTGAKGGSGTTSVAINLATALTELGGAQVALVDLNIPMGDAAAYLNLRPQYTVSDALNAASRLDAVLLESYMSHADKLAVLPGPKEMWPELPPGVNVVTPGAEAITAMLEVLASTYTHVLIDLASNLDKEQLKIVLEKASALVVILTPELPALWRTQRLFSFLESCAGSDKLKLVINRSRRTDPIPESEIEKALRHPVFWKLPNDYNASVEAINSGGPLISNNHSDLAKSYRDLAHELAGVTRPKKAWGIRRLLSRKPRTSDG